MTSKPLVESRKAREAAERGVESPHSRETRWQLERRRRKRMQAVLPAAAAAAIVAVVVAVSATGALPGILGPPASNGGPMHIHPRLAIYNGAAQVTIPTNIGIDQNMWRDHALDQYADGPGMAPLHTHDSSGVIHVESKVTRDYTLGELFKIWGQPLGPQQTLNLRADSAHYLYMTVDGQAYSGTDWESLVFKDNQRIEIHYDPL